MKKQKLKKRNTCYNNFPTQIGRKQFNQHILPCLSKGSRGPKPKLSLYKVFNYILYVLHTGIQWHKLKTYRNEIHYSNVYKWHNRWSKDGSYQNLFEASVEWLHDNDKLDLSILHSDGSNTTAKKGGNLSVTPVINIKKVKK
jgi:transposase